MYLTGGLFTLSKTLTPTLLLASPASLALSQWRLASRTQATSITVFSLLSSSSFAYLSYSMYKTLNQPRSEIFALAALVTAGVLPYSFFLIDGLEKTFVEEVRIKGKGKEKERAAGNNSENESVKQLVDRWGMINLGRTGLGIVGAGLGAWATLW